MRNQKVVTLKRNAKPVQKSRRNVVNNKEIDLRNNKTTVGMGIVFKIVMSEKIKEMTAETKGMIVAVTKLETVKDVQIL